MRTSPVNYLIALGLGGLAWLLAAMVLGNYLGVNVSLANATIDEFLRLYRILLAVAVAVSVLFTWLWFYLGSRRDAAGKLPAARTRWDRMFVAVIVEGILLTFTLVIMFSNESFTLLQYTVLFFVFSLETWLLFWICSLLLSPRTVMNTVRGRR